MRILVLTEQWFPDFTGGSGRVATDTSTVLGQLGHAVTVLAPEQHGLPAISSPSEGVVLHRTLRRGRIFPQTMSDPVRFRRLVQGLDASFDAVIAHQPCGVVAAQALGLPTAYVFHASGYREALHRRSLGISAWKSAKSWGVEQPLRRLERRAAAQASTILVLSAYSRSLIAEDHPLALSKVVVAGGGIDTGRFHPAGDRAALREQLGIAPEERILLTVRRLVARTGVGMLLEAFQALRANGAAAKLVVIGDGEEREALRARAAQLGLAEQVRFLGRIDDDAVLAWYQASDLFVLPTIAYEGFGLATAEALACGTPAVGTPVGATAEILAPLDPQLVSASAAPEHLAATIEAALPTLSPERRAAARSYAERELAMAAVVRRWLAALER